MKRTDKTEFDHLAETREKVVEAALAHVTFDGWTDRTLGMAVQDCGVDEGLARLAFPRGGVDLAIAFHRGADRQLAEALGKAGLEDMRIRDRVTYCVRQRIELIARHREAVRRAAGLFALPMYAPEGMRLMWETADLIWTQCGDTASDYNWYTKRAILSGVYSSTVLFWLGDNSPNSVDTWNFLDRRIENVMQFEKTKAQLRENPLARAALWGPKQVLSLLKAPVTR
jgi:ubiquinone biosynthesis protein COQ9